MPTPMEKCRFCDHQLTHEFVNLVSSPPSNSFLKADQLLTAETYYPLQLFVCEKCWLVQVPEYKLAEEIFSSNYVYFSSFSKSWLAHAEKYVGQMTGRFKLGPTSCVTEVASNDGYLLQYFVKRGVPCYGIEPTQNTAEAARKKGVETIVRFFGVQCAKEMVSQKGKSDLIAANNVLAHVPDINDFVGGFKTLLSNNGVVTVEFPHLLQLVSQNQFDTIYHEHFSYLSLHSVQTIFAKNGLRVFDVEELPTHGGSLRVYADHGSAHAVEPRVQALLEKEKKAGMTELNYYSSFQPVVEKVKNQFLSFLLKAQAEGKVIAGYGAAAKGNTLLNYCGVKNDVIKFVVDASKHKQGLFLPGSHIPVVEESKIRETKPDYIVIFPWNLKTEIVNQLEYVRQWGCKFVISIPELEIF